MSHNKYTIIAHYGEIALKGKNRATFEGALVHNIKKMLANFTPVVRAITGRLVVECSGDEEEIKNIMARVMGLTSFSFVSVTRAEMEAMKEESLALARRGNPRSFRIRASRSEKNYPFTSQDIAIQVGEHIFNSGIKVDLHDPEKTIYIEAVEGRAFIYDKKNVGAGGLPYGVSGNIVILISGGFDSPVAAWKMMRRGCRPIFAHFHSYPQTTRESVENVERIVAELAKWSPEPLTAYLVPFLDIQKFIVSRAELKLAVILYRRSMLRLAEMIAARENAKVLVTGDSVGQVASQTLDNIAAISAAVPMPILRPLAGEDKEEIIALARRIGTHDLSAKPFDDCCNLFMSGSPETHAKIEIIDKVESPLKSELSIFYKKALATTEIVVIM
jgi:thiamine biosynthesis protein ThiI